MSGTSGLRETWGLPVDPEDEYGTGPDAARRATLPLTLSHAFDRATEVLPIPRLGSDGATDLPEPLREAMAAPARASVSEPLPFPRLSQYARFWRDGVRTDYEDDVRQLGILTGEAVLAAVATGQTRWIDRAADGVMLLCELSTWCWVAHEQAHDRHGWVVPDPESPVVDLGAAQTLQTLAWADFALGEHLEQRVPGLRARIRREARVRVFAPYLSRRDWHWLHGAAHNWTGWIHQHLVAGALLLLDDERERRDRDAILALSIAQLDRYLTSFPVDGGIDEGFAYFWNGACRLLEAIDLLITASSDLLSREAVASMDVIGALLRFPQRMELGGGWFVNVADGPARPPAEQPWDVLHRWARHLGAHDVAAQARAHRGSGAAGLVLPQLGLGRVLAACGDPSWTALDGERTYPVLPADTWLPEVQVLVARERGGDPRGLAVAAKGGHNAEAHNHLDVGSCIVALDGTPVLIDLGQPTYTALTFTDRRYEIWTMTSQWHNLPSIRGLGQGVGSEFRASEATAQLDGDSLSSLDLELGTAYPRAAGVRSWHRTATLDREAHAVRIGDVWELEPRQSHTPDEGASPVLIHQVIAGEPVEHETGRLLVRTLSGALAELRWDPGLGAGTLHREGIDDPLLMASWGPAVHRLSLEGPACGSATLTVTAVGHRRLG